MKWKIERLTCMFMLLIVLVVISILSGTAVGFEGHPDLNGDGSIDLFDVNALASRWLNTNCSQNNWCLGADLDYNDIVNFADFGLLVRNWLSVPLTRAPKVKNLAASQGVDFDDYDVHVFYDLIDADPYDRCSVSLEFTDDDGNNWSSITTEDMVEPAIALHIEFDPGVQDGNDCKVRITATDVGGKTGQAVSELFRVEQGGNADTPIIGYVTAKQRNDSSKFVDIYYTLTPDISDYRYYVYMQIRKDEGSDFVTVAGVNGDVGASQQPDSADIKHIVWDPTVDYPGENMPNCMTKVVAHGFRHEFSDEFYVGAASLGTLAGALYDANTGNAIDSAQVMVWDANDEQQPPMSCTTDSNGSFSFEDLPAGEKIIIITKCVSFPPTPESSCYRPIWKTTAIRQDSTTFLNIVMGQLSSDGGGGGESPVVVDVRGKYCSADKHAYYLHGFPMQESFEATIDWKGSGSTKEIHWKTPNHTYVQDCSGESITRTFDMGQDIGIDDVNKTGYLEVFAVRDGNSSPPYPVNLNVLEPPPILDLLAGSVADLLYIPVPTGEGFEYRILGLPGAELSHGNSDGINIPIFNGAMEVKMPMPGKSKKKDKEEVKRKKLKNFDASFSGMVNSDGKAEMATVGWDKTYKKEVRKNVKGKKKEGVKVGTVKATPRASVGLDFYWAEASKKWRLGGTFDLGCGFMYETPPPPKVVAVVMGVPVYVRGELSLDLGLGIGLVGYDEVNGGALWSGAFDFEPLGKGFLGAGVAKVACVEGYLGGGFHSQIGFIPCVEWQGTYIILVGGVRVVVGPFSASVPRRYEWYPGSSGEPSPSTAMMPMGMDILASQSGGNFEPLPRDYLSRGLYPSVGPNTLPGGMEQPVDPNGTVYPYSTPDVTAIGDDMLAVWINDNTTRKMSNRTELMFATYDSRINSWTAPEPVKPDSNTADMNPQLISLASGKAACIWQDANDVVSESTSLELFLGKMEIVAGIYNGQTWSNISLVSNDPCLNRSPRIAGESSDNLMAVWINNTNNDTWGNKNNAKNTIRYSEFNGSNWDPPNQILSLELGRILGTTLAYNGSTATYVYCLDAETNSDPNDPNDHDLYMLRYTGTWEQRQLTDDGIADAAPMLTYADDRLLLFWLRGNNICMAEGPNFTNPTVIRTPGESMGSKDFDVVAGEDGQIALIWSDLSQPKNEPNSIHQVWHDIWVCYYEPGLKVWSLPRQLTWDDAAERFVSGAFGSYRDLFCVYDKTQTRYVEDPNFLIAGQPVVKPKRGRSDLYSMSYRMGVDLSVAVEDLEIRPTNPLSGTETKVSAVVKNLGEYPATDVEVRFSWTDFYEFPGESNILDINDISAVTIGTLAGGEQVEVVPHEPWNVPIIRGYEIPPIPIPQIFQWRKLSVEVSSDQDDEDQDDDQQDRDANDNSATCQIMRPDLTISEISVQTAGPNSIITARVANEGALKADNIKVLLRRDDPNDGNDLDETYITEGLEAGAYCDVSFTVLSEGMMAYAIADPNKQKDEFNEDNNVRPIRINDYSPNEPPVMVYIYASDPVAKEDQPGTEGDGKFIIHRVGPTDSNLTVYYEITGTADNGSDYENLDSLIVIPNDVNWVAIPVELGSLEHDDTSEPAESVIITLESVVPDDPDDNCEIGSFLPAAVVIQDDEPPVPVYICASDPIAVESNSTSEDGEFTIYRIGGTNQNLVVNYDVDGTASYSDYNEIGVSITIPSGASSATIPIEPIDDILDDEGIESVIITLYSSNNYTIDWPSEANVLIIDDDWIKPVVSIKATDSTARENEGGFPKNGEFTVSRAIDTDSSLFVDYTVNGTATDGQDYNSLSGSVEIQPWFPSATFPVSPIDDVNSEDDETVVVEISPNGNYEISSARRATVVIEDNDRIDPPTVEVDASVSTSTAYENGQAQGKITIKAEGQIGPTGLIVYYTRSGTAAHIDYVENLNDWVCIPNDPNNLVAITVTPINDPNIEEHELVVITIEPEPNDAYRIGPRNMGVVVIEDDDWYDDWVRISYDSFESGWGSYYACADADVSIHCGMYAADGNCAANIQGSAELGSAFFYSTAVDVNDYNQIEVVFDFIAVDLAYDEGFSVDYYDGNQWQAVAFYTEGNDFVNGTFYQDQTVDINDTDYNFSTNMKIRFSCNASSDTDDIYIDRIRVSGKTN